MNWRRLIALAMGVQLAGCAFLTEPVTPPASLPKPAPPAAAADPVVPPPAKPVPRVPPPKPAPRPQANPEELVGLDESAVLQLLGNPAEARSEGAARVLSYHASGCALEVMFFLDVKAGDLRVLSYQLDGGTARPSLVKGCYDEFRGAR